MGAAYTPGLKVSERVRILKQRRLPLLGEVTVKVGDQVGSRDVVARTDLPGKVYAVNAAGILNVLETDVPGLMQKKVGDAVKKDELLAISPGIFGLFKNKMTSPVEGTVDAISDRTGRVMLREAPTPIVMRAYIDGRVIEIHEREGCTVETYGAMCQGIFGLGGEVEGAIEIIGAPDAELTPSMFEKDLTGKVCVGGRLLTLAAYEAAKTSGAVAVVVGGIHYRDIRDIVGHEIGVAITGSEKLPTTIVVTEGFGSIDMARATFELATKLNGRKASVNGATQIRAGVIRPELVVPDLTESRETSLDAEVPSLEIGSPVRIIRAPYFGIIGKVVEMPIQLTELESGTVVRVLIAELPDGRRVTVPRANVEIIER